MQSLLIKYGVKFRLNTIPFCRKCFKKCSFVAFQSRVEIWHSLLHVWLPCSLLQKHVPYFKTVINVLLPTMLEHQWNIFAIVRFMWRHNPWICLHGCCAFHSLMNHSWGMNFKHHPINITAPNIQLIWGMQQQQTCYQSHWYNHIYSIATIATLL